MATGFGGFADREATFSAEYPRVTITVDAHDHGHTVTLSGEMDFANADGLLETMANIPLDGHTSVVLDLTGLTFCDASAVSALVRTHHYVRDAGGRLTVTGASGTPRRVLTLTGVDRLLSSH